MGKKRATLAANVIKWRAEVSLAAGYGTASRRSVSARHLQQDCDNAYQ
jgi:hypothetical protein